MTRSVAFRLYFPSRWTQAKVFHRVKELLIGAGVEAKQDSPSKQWRVKISVEEVEPWGTTPKKKVMAGLPTRKESV